MVNHFQPLLKNAYIIVQILSRVFETVVKQTFGEQSNNDGNPLR